MLEQLSIVAVDPAVLGRGQSFCGRIRPTPPAATAPTCASGASRRSFPRPADQAGTASAAAPAAADRSATTRPSTGPQRHRTGLRAPKAVARHRHSVRQARPHLPRRPRPRSDPHLDPLTSETRPSSHVSSPTIVAFGACATRDRIGRPGSARPEGNRCAWVVLTGRAQLVVVRREPDPSGSIRSGCLLCLSCVSGAMLWMLASRPVRSGWLRIDDDICGISRHIFRPRSQELISAIGRPHWSGAMGTFSISWSCAQYGR
jgi:hypothetical protein